MKKLLSSILALALLLTTFGGCAAPAASKVSTSGGEVSTEINFDEEPYEINFLYLVASEGANQSKVEAAVSELALKELNMKVNLIPMTFGTYQSQISMTLAANEPLDLLPVMSNNFATFIESQYIRNSADYLDYAKDIKEIMGVDANCGYIGDFLVGFSQMKERAYPAGLIVRKDLLEKSGFKVEDFNINVKDYKSFDKLGELFAKVKEQNPGIICVDGTSIMGLQIESYIDNLGNMFGVIENYGQEKKITNWYESEQYKNFCLIARDWFTKGYLSGDASVNQDSGEIKMKAGNSFGYITNVKPNTNVEKLAQTGYEVEVIPLSEIMKSTNSVNAMLYAVANASKDPKKAMQFLNWTYKSQEFEDLINWGIEGEDWVLNEEKLAAYPDGVTATTVGYHNDFGFAYPNQFAGHAWAGNPVDIWDQYKVYNSKLMTSVAFGFTFNPTSIATEEAQLNSVNDQYRKDLAFGAIEIEEGLKKFNDALYGAGLQKVMDEKQKQLDEWLAKK